MSYLPDTTGIPDLACELRGLLAHVRLIDVASALAAIFGPSANARARKPLRRRLERAVAMLVEQRLVSLTQVLRPKAHANAIQLASRPFVCWMPGNHKKHLDALGCVESTGSQCPFHQPVHSATWPWADYEAVQAYLLISPDDAPVGSGDFRVLLDRMLPERQSRDEHGRILWAAWKQAGERTNTFRGSVAIYLRQRLERPEFASGWQGVNMFTDRERGSQPDAVIIDGKGQPRLALAYATSDMNLVALHTYCREHSLPYEVWGDAGTPAWYNPDVADKHIEHQRDEIIRSCGYMHTIPAMAEPSR